MEGNKLTGKHVYGVLGAGRQGTAAAYDMARFGEAEAVILADVDRKVANNVARHVNDLCGGEVAESVRIDVKNQTQVKRFLDDVGVVLSAVPYFYNLRVAKAAIRARASMCDLGGNTDIVRQELRLDQEAKAAGISIVPDCGLDPGMGASLAAMEWSYLTGPAKSTYGAVAYLKSRGHLSTIFSRSTSTASPMSTQGMRSACVAARLWKCPVLRSWSCLTFRSPLAGSKLS